MSQDEQPPPPATSQPAPRAKARPRLTYAKRALLLAMRRNCPDASTAHIAQAIGCSRRQAERIIGMAQTDRRQLTQELMQSAITERLDDWATASRNGAKKGYHQGAQAWLVAAQAIDPDKPQATTVQTGISVTLAFPLPGVPQSLTPPAIDTTATTPHTAPHTAPARDTATVTLDPSQVEPSLPHAPAPD